MWGTKNFFAAAGIFVFLGFVGTAIPNESSDITDSTYSNCLRYSEYETKDACNSYCQAGMKNWRNECEKHCEISNKAETVDYDHLHICVKTEIGNAIKYVCEVGFNCKPGPGIFSCVGYCGEKSPDGCWCDALCHQYGDCCPDMKVACPGL